MTTSVTVEARIQTLKLTQNEIIINLVDGRIVKVPCAWYPKLYSANQKQRQKYRLIGDGIGIHWPELDEDLSVEGFLAI